MLSCRVEGKAAGTLDAYGKKLKGFRCDTGALRAYARGCVNELAFPVHPHSLRHTFATLRLRNGGDSLMLQRLLGHATLTMTNRYRQGVGSLDAMKTRRPLDAIAKNNRHGQGLESVLPRKTTLPSFAVERLLFRRDRLVRSEPSFGGANDRSDRFWDRGGWW